MTSINPLYTERFLLLEPLGMHTRCILQKNSFLSFVWIFAIIVTVYTFCKCSFLNILYGACINVIHACIQEAVLFRF